jgi:hypothetical protein
MDLYDKLKTIYRMVDFIIEHGGDEDEIDLVTEYQCTLPDKLKEIEQELLTLSE